jgi:uncharacterized membrane protein YidH (DUF202 family)
MENEASGTNGYLISVLSSLGVIIIGVALTLLVLPFTLAYLTTLIGIPFQLDTGGQGIIIGFGSMATLVATYVVWNRTRNITKSQ